MFQFPAFLPHTLCVQVWVTSYDGCRVPPFGYRRIFASLPLPVAFRRSVRPSSVPSGQAFAVRPSLMGGQPNPWNRIQLQDAMSRHRGAKPRRRCELLGEISLLSPG